jgi:hypothetical protein
MPVKKPAHKTGHFAAIHCAFGSSHFLGNGREAEHAMTVTIQYLS